MRGRSAATRDWDAETYHAVSDPHEEWARWRCSSGSTLSGDETVLDAGCGRGRVTGDADRAAARRAAWSPSTAPRRWSRRCASVLRPRRRGAGRRPDRAGAGRAGRRRLLERRLPLDPRPRRALRAACARRCGPAAASPPSAAAPATSPRTAQAIATRSPRASPIAAHFEGFERALELRRRRGDRGAAARRRLRPRSAAGCSRGRSQPPEPARVHCARSASARTLDRLPEELRDPFVADVLEPSRAAAACSTTCASTSRPSPPSP